MTTTTVHYPAGSLHELREALRGVCYASVSAEAVTLATRILDLLARVSESVRMPVPLNREFLDQIHRDGQRLRELCGHHGPGAAREGFAIRTLTDPRYLDVLPHYCGGRRVSPPATA